MPVVAWWCCGGVVAVVAWLWCHGCGGGVDATECLIPNETHPPVVQPRQIYPHPYIPMV